MIRTFVVLTLSFFLICATAPGAVESEAQTELFANRYENAASLYKKLLAEHPEDGDGWCGLVRAELRLHHSREAYAAAEQALSKAPGSPGAEAAAGFADYRRGDLPAAETHFKTALKINPDYPEALKGLASVYTTISWFRSARGLREKAFLHAPADPELMVAHANTLKGAEHIAALEAALAQLDPASEEARNLRVHIANDRAVGERKLRRLVSPYENSSFRLVQLMDGPRVERGLGVELRLNQKRTVKLLLDTGASGIAVSPKVAEKAGLEAISGETSETKGIGDQKAQTTVSYLASEIRAGDVIFADYPVSVFRSAQSADYDGIIGADVFQAFLVKIDFVKLMLSLEARPGGAPASEEPRDWNGPPAAGFYRVFRFGDHLTVPTFINGGRSTLFLIDSGASSNLIDTAVAKEFTSVSGDFRTTVTGLQGKVDKTSRASHVSLVFAGFRQDNPDLLSISLEKMGDSMGTGVAGILGMPVLSNLAVTIDYRDGSVRFEHNRP